MTISSDTRTSKSSLNSLLLPKTHWRSIYFITSISMMDTMRISTVMSNSWPYISSLDADISENYYGLANSVFTLAAAIASLLSGWLSNKISHTKPPIMIGQTLAIITCIIYANLELMPNNRRYGFFVCQVLLGLANGAIQTWRVDVAMSTTDHDRSKANSLIGFSLNIGFILGPLVVMLLGRILSNGSISLPWGVHLSLYTAPVYFMTFISIIGLIILLIGFDGRMDKTHKDEVERSNDLKGKWAIKSSIQLEKSPLDMEKAHLEIVPSTDVSVEEIPKIEKAKVLQFDKNAIFACIIARLCICGLILYLTSLSAPYSMTVFGWSGEQMVSYNMLIQFSTGIIGLFVCLGYSFRLLSHLDERRCITFALIVLLLFFLFTYPWPFLNTSMPLPTFTNETLDNSTQTLITQGCSPQKYSWCLSTPAINVLVYHASLIFTLGVILPIGNINLDGLYSRLLGPIKQGTMQGVFVALSDIVLFIGPVIITNVYQWGGPRPVWAGMICLFGMGIAFWIYSYERLVPKYRTVQKINKDKKKHLS